ncbi:MAG: hypothetical protein PVG48_02695, partial [Candidatus Bathyarchaeota archaeon]
TEKEDKQGSVWKGLERSLFNLLHRELLSLFSFFKPQTNELSVPYIRCQRNFCKIVQSDTKP